jgi:hypothetical protein
MEQKKEQYIAHNKGMTTPCLYKDCEDYGQELFNAVFNPPLDVKEEGWEERFDEQFENIIRAEYNERDRRHRPVHPSDPRGEIKSFITSEIQAALEKQAREIDGKILQASIEGYKKVFIDGKEFYYQLWLLK